MRKIVSLSIALIFVISFFAVHCEQSGFDFSSMSDEELTALIESAQSELLSRQNQKDISADNSLEEQLAEQPLSVESTSFVIRSEKYKSLYPDLLEAILVNNSDEDIKDAVVAFMAWDENNLPVLLKAQFDFGNADYVKRVNYSGINLIPGATFGENAGMALDTSVGAITTVKAIVVSYETFEGTSWSNPYYDAFIEKYAGQKLS